MKRSTQQIESKADLKSLEGLTKSKRGGKRPGAGRPKGRYSVRACAGVYGHEAAEGLNESHYTAWRSKHINEHAHEFIRHLNRVDDLNARVRYYEDGKYPIYPPLLSDHQALQLCRSELTIKGRRRLTPDQQLKELLRRHRDVVERYYEQCFNGDGESMSQRDWKFGGFAKQLLEVKK